MRGPGAARGIVFREDPRAWNRSGRVRSIAGRRAAHGFFLREVALVGDAAVLRVAGAGAVGAAHFLDGLGLGDGAAFADGIELVAEFAPGEEAVHFAGAVHLAFDADAGGQVFEEDAVGGLVDFLSA